MNQIRHDIILTRDGMRAEIAALLMLDPTHIADDDNLMDLGLDSLRAMTLVLQWQDSGLGIDFAELAQSPTLAHWWACVRRRNPHRT